MAYNWYQTHAPGWGTQQYQFGPPPSPGYLTSPSWGGRDYYRAHVGRTEDLALYEYAMNKLASGALGVGKHEAKRWHRLAYAGLGEVARMLPTEIGYAAAYEAYRIYIHHNARLYESLYSRPERQREALVATAVAEVQRLWQDTGRAYDEFGLRTAAEAAAASAALIFRNHLEYDANDPYGTPGGGGYRRTRHNSIAPSTASSPYSSSYSLDPYALDDTTLRRSRYGYRDGINRSPYLGGVSGVGAGAVGAGAVGAVGVGSGAGAGALNTYNSTASMPVPMPSSSPYPGHTSYPASYAQGSIVLPPASNSYGGAPSTSYSTGYPQGPAALPVSQGYPSSYSSGGSYGGMGQQQAPVVVIPQTGHHHHHRHRSLGFGHRHRRHRSLERYY